MRTSSRYRRIPLYFCLFSRSCETVTLSTNEIKLYITNGKYLGARAGEFFSQKSVGPPLHFTKTKLLTSNLKMTDKITTLPSLLYGMYVMYVSLSVYTTSFNVKVGAGVRA